MTARPPPSNPSGYRGRFAPSPTGDLHFGSLLAAFGSWLLARHAGGEWWVRIEDLDPPREVAGAAAQQLETLLAFGLQPDAPVVRQSDRGRLYQRALERLLDEGHAFACHCTRSELVVSDGVHRRCVARSRRRQPAVRLRVPDDTNVAFTDAVMGPQTQRVDLVAGDFVLRRADGCWAYQLAVVVDDAEQGITDVVRGADLLDSTARQLFLMQRLGLTPPQHAHLPLVFDTHGRKLSKSDRSRPVDPANPPSALRLAWQALGQTPDVLADCGDLASLLAATRSAFDPACIPANTAPDAALHNRIFMKPG